MSLVFGLKNWLLLTLNRWIFFSCVIILRTFFNLPPIPIILELLKVVWKQNAILEDEELSQAIGMIIPRSLINDTANHFIFPKWASLPLAQLLNTFLAKTLPNRGRKDFLYEQNRILIGNIRMLSQFSAKAGECCSKSHHSNAKIIQNTFFNAATWP